MIDLEKLYTMSVGQIEAVHISLGKYQQKILINKRAKTRWGACKPILEKNCFGRIEVTGYQIEIAENLIKNGNEQAVLNTLIHELLHTCKGCQNHGALWKKYAQLMNDTYGYDIKRVTSIEEKSGVTFEEKSAHYKVECLNCKTAFYRMKKSKVILHPNQYRCSKCGGKLKVIHL